MVGFRIGVAEQPRNRSCTIATKVRERVMVYVATVFIVRVPESCRLETCGRERVHASRNGYTPPCFRRAPDNIAPHPNDARLLS